MGRCITPYIKRDKLTGESQSHPCGKCPECFKRRISSWSFRLMQQWKTAHSATFITLTYDTNYVPITPNGFMGLDKRDVQLFLKRLRKAHGTPVPDIKYYACGEYGGKSKRPHYHLIMFNVKLELIQPAWTKGSIHYGEVSAASIGYCLKYMSKPSKIPMHRNDDRLKEFSLMSKKIGLNYITPEMIRWHHASLHDRMYCTTEDGKKIAMPRYYKEKIYHETQRKAIGFAAQQRQAKIDKKLERAGTLPTAKQLVESHKSAFEKMYRKSEEGRNKI